MKLIKSALWTSAGLIGLAFILATPATADHVILDDLIVNGSACVGFDCVNGESFGFDTLRLKENNLRIKFQDTSTSASFPTNDWQLTANDSSNGGAEKFSIDDISGGRTPFTVEAGAPSHSLYVEDGGRIGFGTSTPVVELHVVDGDTPTLRLEQDGSSGFTPQTWDLAGNETNIFIRDATHGSKLPFRIRPDAPTSSIDVASDGDVGLGTSSPSASLHVRRTNETAQVFVQEASGTEANRSLLRLENNGAVRFDLVNTAGQEWRFNNFGANGNFHFSKNTGTGIGNVITARGINDPNGSASVTILGSLEATNVTFTSSRERKTNFAAVDEQEILERLLSLPITEWQFKADSQRERHIGPIAEDFAGAFSIGESDRISVTDANGITIAAIQGLAQQLSEKSEELQRLQSQNESLEARLEALEQLLEGQN